MIISFSGLDGAGKSTFTNLLFDDLKNKGFKVKKIYLGNYFVIGVFPLLVRFFLSNNYSLNKKTNKKKFLLKMWMPLFFLDSIFYIIYLKINNYFYDFIITDRFFLDKIVSLNYLGYSSNFYNKLFIKSFLKPDTHFYLFDNLEKLKNRETNDNHSIEFYEEMSLIFSFFLKNLKKTKIKTQNKKDAIKNIYNHQNLIMYLK